MSVVIELDEKLVAQIDEVAKGFNQNRLEYINEILQKSLQKDFAKKSQSEDCVKVGKFVESYQKVPQKPEEYEIWQDEQAWEDK